MEFIQQYISELFLIVTALLLAFLPIKHVLHIFQQNRYELPRYNQWLQNYAFKKPLGMLPTIAIIVMVTVISFLSFPLWMKNSISSIIAVLYFSFLFLFESKKKYIKPLKVTGRVIRQIVVMVLLILGLDGLVIFFLPVTYWFLLFVISLVGPWVFIYLVYWITYPAEKLVQNYYLNQAKKILHAQKNLIKVGITGSYGKTSSKNILQEILSEKFYSLMTPASFNTPMGITITIRTLLKPLHQVFICEMGADKVGEIDFLTKFVEPQYGMVTSIGPQHLNTFKSIDNIINEKMKMIENLPITGVGVLNKDNEYIRNYYIKNKCKIVWYGIEQEEVDYRAIHIHYSPQGSSFDVFTSEKTTHHFETRLLGEHNIANILASIALGRELGVSWEQLQKAVKKVRYVEHRLEVKKINGYTFIDNAFNSNPVGAKMSLEVLQGMPGRRVIVTPGMIDLGEQQDQLNKEFGKEMLGKADLVILVGVQQTKAIQEGLKEVSFPSENIQVVKTVKEAFDYVYHNLSTEDTILLENDLPDAFNN